MLQVLIFGCFLIVKECRDTFQLMKFQVFWRCGNMLIDKWWVWICSLMLLCEEMVWVALELSGYKLVWSTDGSVLPAVNLKWSSSLNTYTIYTVALSKTGNCRLSSSERHEVAYILWKFMSELELNWVEWCTEVSTQTHVFSNRGDTAAGKPVDTLSYLMCVWLCVIVNVEKKTN